MFGITANAEQNPPPVGGGDSTGAWIIENGDTITRENQEIRLKGNLIIENGGKLTFNNVTLKMNCSSDGEFKIEVQNGGEFYIYDNDNNKETTYDASVITAYSTSNEYLFYVNNGAKMIMKNSKLHECGYEFNVPSGNHAGMRIMSNDVLIENCTITDNYYGIFFITNVNPKIFSNEISNNEEKSVYIDDSNPVLNNNIINTYDTAISIHGSSNPILTNNYISAKKGIIIGGSVNSMMINNTIKNCDYAFYIVGTDSAEVTLINCTLEDIDEKDIWFNGNGDIKIIVKNISCGSSLSRKYKEGSEAETHVYWFLHVKVIDDEEKPVVNAKIRIRDNAKGDYDENFTSGPDGWKKWILIFERLSKDEGGIGYSPFNIDASKDGSTVSVDDFTFWDWKSKELILKLDFNSPEISNVQTEDLKDDSVTITWETNEDSDSLVKYGFDQGYGLEKYNSNLVKSHSVKLTGLEPDTTYHFCVNSTDDYGNYKQSNDYEFKTLDSIPPEIFNIKNSTPTGTSVIISWETDELSNSTVKYGYDESYGFEKSDETLVTLHSIELTELNSDVLYHFCVKSTDESDNSNQSEDFTFLTLDILKPMITKIENSTPIGRSVTITWKTNEPCDSLVKYGLDDNYGQTEYDSKLTNSHSITLTNLEPETLYHFSVNSTDDNLNSNESEDFTFQTLDDIPPEISEIDVKLITKNSARITWTTNELCDSYVHYGKGIVYTLVESKSELGTSHIIDLTDLDEETEYHFGVNSTDENENSNQSEDYTFTTLKDTGDTDPPENPTFSPVNGEKVNHKKPTITITFSEEVIITDAKLNSIDIKDDLQSSDYIVFTYTPNDDLSEGDNTISVKAKDLNDNEMTESAISTFTIEIVPIDETSPEITEVAETGISQNSTYITWTTDEPSTSQIEYGITDGYGNTTDKDSNLVTLHNVSISNLEPNTTYHYRMISIDEFGNENISEDYTFKTLEKPGEPPVKEEINIEVKLEITDNEIKENDEVIIKASVTNKGTTTIEVDIVFMDNDKKIGEVKITIEPGKSKSSSINWTAKNGNHTIKIVVKYDGKEVSNGTASKKIEVTEISVDGDESGFNLVLLVPIIIIPIVIVFGLMMRNRGGEIKPQIPIQQNVPQQTFQTQQQTQVPQQTPQQAFKKCPYCNAQVPGQFKFCNMCGKEMELRQQQVPNAQPGFNLCPYCNAQVPIQFKFCNMCGKEIGQNHG